MTHTTVRESIEVAASTMRRWATRGAKLFRGTPNSNVIRLTNRITAGRYVLLAAYGANGYTRVRLARRDVTLTSADTPSATPRILIAAGRTRPKAVHLRFSDGNVATAHPLDGGWLLPVDQFSELGTTAEIAVRWAVRHVPIYWPMPAIPIAASSDREIVVCAGSARTACIATVAPTPVLSCDWDATTGRLTVHSSELTDQAALRITQAGTSFEFELPVSEEAANSNRVTGSSTEPVEQKRVLTLGDTARFGTRIPLAPGSWDIQANLGSDWHAIGLSGPAEPSGWRDAAGGVRCLPVWSPVAASIEVEVVAQRLRKPPASTADVGVAAHRSDSPTALFQVFAGNALGCNPGAIYREFRKQAPDWDIRWVTQPGHAYAPEGATAVFHESADWWETLQRSDLIVANANINARFRRRADQVFLQTWHGTPLKRLGMDMASFARFEPNYRANLRTQSAQWTHLLSPNPFCSEIFPHAFAYEGALVEFGSPRNDLLRAPEGERFKRASSVRQRLGVPAKNRMVLYAPTWRDDSSASLNTIASPAALGQRLGADVTVLARLHYNVVERPGWAGAANVIDVSSYPDVGELYLVSDVLATDYSSTMFDFACTGKPMVFYCPDLAEYRDSMRGFYFDFDTEAPGPICASEPEFAERVRDALDSFRPDGSASIPAEYEDRYRAFAHKFCEFEDGRVAERVARNLLKSVGSLQR